VVLDDAPGVVASVEHLADLGHERVGFVGGPDMFLHARHRRDAWRTTCERRGLSVDERLELEGDFSGASGAMGMARLLEMPTHDRPTAVLFANDLMAVAGVAEAQRRGCRVPDEISVVGFDDIAVAAHVHPSLTTVVQDAVAWGRAATRAVFDLVEHGEASDLELPPARLVVRESTGPAPAHARPGRRPSTSTMGTP
jgi:DNA-binding LacI/PurR family transcriptional regulator